MSETCAVCHKGKGPEKCEVCGFSDNGVINRTFPIPEDAQNWLDTVVKPYRAQWEAKKREAELLAQLEEAKKREAELLKQLEAAKVNVIIRPSPVPNTFTDPRDGKVYKTAKIGNQVWMAKNLDYDAPDSKCYDNDPTNGEKYGRLYNWETAMKVCPMGWHLPSNDEWQTLVDFVGGKEIAGNKLKARSGWNKNGNGKDVYGFSALPGGYFDFLGFQDIGISGNWWGSSEDFGFGADGQYMNFGNKGTLMKIYGYSELLSVRCLQD